MAPRIDAACDQTSSFAAARDANLAEVTRILRLAAVDYAPIDDEGAERSQVAVAFEDRDRFLEAFETHASPGTILAALPWVDLVRLQAGRRSGWREQLARRRAEMATGYVVYRLGRTSPDGQVLGMPYATVISLWNRYDEDDGVVVLRSGTSNRWTQRVPTTAEALKSKGITGVVGSELSGRVGVTSMTDPVDLVCLWVDGDDPAWKTRREQRLRDVDGLVGASPAAEATSAHLFRSRDELRYALRSVQMWAPFVRHVYLVTDGQAPPWLDQAGPGLTLVDHRDILPADVLPTFNSNAIDTALHRIPGLSEHFLVTNDDMLFVGPVTADHFFGPGGAPRLFLSKAGIPFGPPIQGEPAVDACGRNNRELLERAYGRTITQKFKHIMIPQRRSDRELVADRFQREFLATQSHPFRDAGDISFSHLCLYDALARGQAVVSSLPYDYISLGDPTMARRLERLSRQPGNLKVICLNDGDSVAITDQFGAQVGELVVDPHERDELVVRALERMFPVASSWERAAS